MVLFVIPAAKRESCQGSFNPQSVETNRYSEILPQQHIKARKKTNFIGMYLAL